jgi:hypothetical protein
MKFFDLSDCAAGLYLKNEIRGHPQKSVLFVFYYLIAHGFTRMFFFNRRGIRGYTEETEDWKSNTYFSASSAKPLFSLWFKYFKDEAKACFKWAKQTRKYSCTIIFTFTAISS